MLTIYRVHSIAFSFQKCHKASWLSIDRRAFRKSPARILPLMEHNNHRCNRTQHATTLLWVWRRGMHAFLWQLFCERRYLYMNKLPFLCKVSGIKLSQEDVQLFCERRNVFCILSNFWLGVGPLLGSTIICPTSYVGALAFNFYYAAIFLELQNYQFMNLVEFIFFNKRRLLPALTLKKSTPFPIQL